MMVTKEFANQFATEWVDAWNSHDIDKILSHYSDDFIIETPMAAILFPESNGLVIGKQEVRKHWLIGLERIPNLKFEIMDVLVGGSSISVYYLNTGNLKKSVETMFFNDNLKVNKAIVSYSE
jgi:ketosteroid isomerase-like protein